MLAKKLSIPKKVQGSWIPEQDALLLDSEAKKIGFKTSTALASFILSEWCATKRVELAEIIIAQSKKKRGKK